MLELLESKRIGISKTDLPPCCLCIHPEDNSIIILGTYKLEDNGRRHGSVDIYRFDRTKSNENDNLKLLNRYSTESAILDIKFNHFDNSFIATAHSTGNLILWKYKLSDNTLERAKDYQLFNKESLITSINFSPNDKDKLLATSTSGESAIVNLTDYSYELLNTIHDLECWTGIFGELGDLSQVVYTGGDDAKLIAHDLRTPSHIWSTNSRHHSAGVVSILSPGPNWNQSNPHQLWTGSYDDHLRILDLRLLDKSNPSLIPGYIPKVLKEKNLGGGVWRLIPSPLINDNRVMACCMYDGARILESNDDDFQVTRYFKRDHESMCYGGDWSSEGNFIVTSSFYDNIVQIWSPNDTTT